MRRIAIPIAAAALVAAALAVMLLWEGTLQLGRAPQDAGPRPEDLAEKSAGPEGDAAAPGDPSKAATPATDPLRQAIDAARSAYLASVYATGLPSEEIARRRKEEFDRSVAALAALGPDALPELLRRLRREKNDHAKLLLLTGMSRIRGEAGIRTALDALRFLGEDPVKQLFLDRLVRAGDAEDGRLVEAILFRETRADDRVSLLACAALRGSQAVTGQLPRVATTDPDPRVRLQALVTAERLKEPLGVQTLSQIATGDPDPTVRGKAVGLAAADAGDLASVARNVLARETDPEVGRLVVDALSRSEDPRAQEALQEAAEGAMAPEARERASKALRLRELKGRYEKTKGSEGQPFEPSGDVPR